MRGLLTALVAVAAGCASTPAKDPFPADDEREKPAAVAFLDDEPITYADVARYLRSRDPQAFFRNLDGLALERLTRKEATHLGVTVPEPDLERATNRKMVAWEQRVKTAARRQTGEEIDLALWLQRVARLSMPQFRTMVRKETEVELLQNRLLRYEMFTSPRLELSIVVVPRQRAAEDLAKRVRGGEDFAAIARQHSVHEDTKPRGGRIPFPLVPADINDASTRRALFEAEEGAVVGPFPTRGGKQTFFQFFRVHRKVAARDLSYEQLAAEVERDLKARPVPMAEWEYWRQRLLLRHGIVAAPYSSS